MRKRTERREAERAAAKLATNREKLFALEPGGSPAHPRVVTSASVIEPQALATPCPRDGAALRLDEHAAEGGLRVVRMACSICGAKRALWFRIATAN